MKSSIMLFATLLTGLSAGLFYAWAVSVIPGLKNTSDNNYLQTMQSINRAILNPGFFIIFFGSALLLIASIYFQYKIETSITFWLIIASFIFYLVGTLGVTIFGNVPMNEGLDKINLASLSPDQLKLTRVNYENKWNFYHYIRTFFSVLSFTSILFASVIGQKLTSHF